MNIGSTVIYIPVILSACLVSETPLRREAHVFV